MRSILFVRILLLLLPVTSLATERLYIHFDRTEFRAGDTVRFKAYVLWDGLPSSRSTHFYVQVFNEKNVSVTAAHFPVLGATVDGGFILPDSIATGNYYIQAFTPLMRSAASDVYVKNIWVDGPGFRSEKRAVGSLSQLTFFPEDGRLHADQLNFVVFRAMDAFGNPASAKGIIQTMDGQTIAPFQTLMPGIGFVRFRPRTGQQYRAIVDSTRKYFSLPPVVMGSVQLQVEAERGGKKFQLARSLKEKLSSDAFRLTATIREQIVYDQEISFGGYPSLVGHLLTDSLPSGILLFQLYDSEGKLLAKRPCFVDRAEWSAPVSLQPISTISRPRSDTARFQLELTDSVMSSLSLSVMNADRSWPDESILMRLMLLNDAGLTPTEASKFLEPLHWNTDLAEWLLISAVERAQSQRTEKSVVPDRSGSYFTMNGTVFDARSNERMVGGDLNIVLETASGFTKQWSLTPSEQGHFSIDSIIYAGMGSFYAYYADRKGKVRAVRVESKFSGMDSFQVSLVSGAMTRAGRVQLSSARFNEFVAGDPKAKTLQPVQLDRQANRSPEETVSDQYTTGVFREAGKVTIDNVNNPVNDKSINVIDFIKNRIQQVEIQGGRFVNRKNISLSTGQKWQVGLFLNEQPVDMSLLRTIRAVDVALIKFYEAGFVGAGSNYPGGALAIYLKDRQEVGTPRTDPPFYSGPGFTDIPALGKSWPGMDERVFYWDPSIVVDKTRTELAIPVPEKISAYRLVLSGFDVRGRLIWIQQELRK